MQCHNAGKWASSQTLLSCGPNPDVSQLPVLQPHFSLCIPVDDHTPLLTILTASAHLCAAVPHCVLTYPWSFALPWQGNWDPSGKAQGGAPSPAPAARPAPHEVSSSWLVLQWKEMKNHLAVLAHILQGNRRYSCSSQELQGNDLVLSAEAAIAEEQVRQEYSAPSTLLIILSWLQSPILKLHWHKCFLRQLPEVQRHKEGSSTLSPRHSSALWKELACSYHPLGASPQADELEAAALHWMGSRTVRREVLPAEWQWITGAIIILHGWLWEDCSGRSSWPAARGASCHTWGPLGQLSFKEVRHGKKQFW